MIKYCQHFDTRIYLSFRSVLYVFYFSFSIFLVSFFASACVLIRPFLFVYYFEFDVETTLLLRIFDNDNSTRIEMNIQRQATKKNINESTEIYDVRRRRNRQPDFQFCTRFLVQTYVYMLPTVCVVCETE